MKKGPSKKWLKRFKKELKRRIPPIKISQAQFDGLPDASYYKSASHANGHGRVIKSRGYRDSRHNHQRTHLNHTTFRDTHSFLDRLDEKDVVSWKF